jgi:hypothetical protein
VGNAIGLEEIDCALDSGLLRGHMVLKAHRGLVVQ